MDTGRFIQAVAPAAQRAHTQYRVPASVSLAQSILESGWGTSVLAIYGHAFFGIKCKTDYFSPYQLGCMDKSSLEYFDPSNPVAIVSAFRTYRSVDDSFADHGYFLKNSARYAAAFNTSNPDDFIREVGKAGYATDPGYANQIIGIMQRYSLYRYDTSAINSTPVAVDGAIGSKYASLGGAGSALSYPIGGEQDGPVSGSRMMTFNKGLLAYSSTGGAHPIVGALWDHYRFSQNVRNHLRLVTSDAYWSGGVQMQSFTGGRMYRINGTHYDVWGEIWRTYARLGAEGGRLGLPVGPEVCGIRNGGCYQNFQGGAILWSPTTGAHPNWGMIRGKYASLGYETGRLGLPTSDEVCGLTGGGCYQDFEGGAIVWRSGTGAHPSWGAIRPVWADAGFENGRLGYPTSDEVCGLRDGGCYQNYQGGAILWSAATGAHSSWGAIRAAYAAQRYETGVLGYPTTNEVCGLVNGGCYQNFQGGGITWTSTVGAAPTWGAIRGYWGANGWERGRFGYPTTAPVCSGSPSTQCSQTFQGGTIRWDTARGAYSP